MNLLSSLVNLSFSAEHRLKAIELVPRSKHFSALQALA